MKKIIYYGSIAPSAHNAQMWKVKFLSDRELAVFRYENIAKLPGNENHWASLISIGAFIENMVQSAGAFNLTGEVQITCRKRDDREIARITFTGNDAGEPSGVIPFIEKRHSDRSLFFKKALDFRVIDRLLFNKNIYYFSLNSDEGCAIRNGLIESARPKGLLGRFQTFFYNVKAYAENCSGFFVITSDSNYAGSVVEAGRLMERFWIKAAELDVAVLPMSSILESKPWKNEIGLKLKIKEPVQMILRAGYVKDYGKNKKIKKHINKIIVR